MLWYRRVVKGALATARHTVFLIIAGSIAALSLSAAERSAVPLSEADPSTKDLVSRIVASAGGEQALANIRSMHERMTIEERTAKGAIRTEVDGVIVFPDRLYADVRSGSNALTLVVSERESYIVPRTGPVEGAAVKLEEGERSDLMRLFNEDPVVLLKQRNDKRFRFATGRVIDAGGRSLTELLVSAPGMDATWLVDSSGVITAVHSGGAESRYSQWKTVNGLSVPLRSEALINGETVSSLQRTQYEVNPLLDLDALFRRPTLWLMRLAVQPVAKNNPYRKGAAVNVITDSSRGGFSSYDSSESNYSSGYSYQAPIVVIVDGY